MTTAYVDSSCILAIAFGERGAAAIERRLNAFDQLTSSNLLEAEVCAAFAREGLEPDRSLLSTLAWVAPERALHAEIARVLEAGYVRGADCWHLATALYLAGNPAKLSFLTLGARQARVAAALGFES
jgi:uncharacterized protein with PIN domain